MAQTVRIGILGSGHMAQTMAAAIRHVPGLAVAGFASRDPVRARDIATALRLGRGFQGTEDLLADPEVDAVYIAGDTASHAAAALAAIAAGKPVLCEKPCATSAADARAIAAAATSRGTLFMEAIATPFLPVVATALDMAAKGALGQLRQLDATFGYLSTRESHPGCYAPMGGGVLLDRAVYLVTLARLALGPVARVEAAVARDAEGIDIHAALILSHAHDGVSLLGASLVTELGNAMTIAGAKATALVDAPLLSAERLALRHGGTPSRPKPAAGLRGRVRESSIARHLRQAIRGRSMRRLSYGASPYVPELVHFRDLVRAGAVASPILPPSLSVEVAEILDQARTAAA